VALPFDEQFVAFQSAVAGRYSLERELGRGGMGVVYLAREVRLDRPVAIKLLPPQADAAGLRERFLREARTAAKLSHPHVIPIFAVEEVGSFVFFAMAYVEGTTLGARVRERGPLPPSEAAKMLREVAWALAYAHEQGVIHRDIKPDNILLEHGTGRALVADFGIAGQVKDASSWQGGEIIGTPEFMSPEQALGESLDHRSDLYSLGAVAFFALSGRLPFEAENSSAVLAKQVSQLAPVLADVAPGVPRRLSQLVEQCLSKDRQQRPQSAAQMGEMLGRTLDQRRELPVALRAFVKHDSRFASPGVVLYLWGALVAAGLVGYPLGMVASWGTLGFAMIAVPAAVLIARARKLLKSGFQHADLEVAFKTEIERANEERAFVGGHQATSLERILKLGGIAGLVMTPLFLVSLATLELIGARPGPILQFVMFGLGPPAMVAGDLCGLGYLTLLNRRRDVDTIFWGKLWAGRFGRWLFKVARRMLPKGFAPSAMTHRPTELVIAMAADQLYEALPKETKKGLGDLPDVVSRLEADARRMRARLEELQDSIRDGGPTGNDRADRVMAQLRSEREKLQGRLAETVAALETIRLSLLHLHAGKVSVQSLTTDLGRAREIASGVDRLMEGVREVELILKTPDRQPARPREAS
jgi:serine/threonine-protein kinase